MVLAMEQQSECEAAEWLATGAGTRNKYHIIIIQRVIKLIFCTIYCSRLFQPWSLDIPPKSNNLSFNNQNPKDGEWNRILEFNFTSSIKIKYVYYSSYTAAG